MMEELFLVLRLFIDEDDGASLAEYLVLLGVLVLVVAGGILAFSGAIGTAFQEWATWIGGNASPP